jgi:cysteine desulfurase
MPRTPIYLDHHATTPVDPRVLDAMRPFFGERFGNAASRVHAHGRDARDAVEGARAEVAGLIGVGQSEIVFTSGATESDNLALLGTARARASEGRHVVTVRTEHKAVLDPCAALEAEGWKVTRLDVNEHGLVSPRAIEDALSSETVLVSVMLANNEIGIAQDLATIGALTRPRGITFHCDAAQGLGYLPLDVDTMNIDLASLSAHKMYGPKGVGALYASHACQTRGVPAPLMHGGGHERGLRPGTLDVPSVVGFGAAAKILREEGAEEAARLGRLRDALETRLLESLDEVRVNGGGTRRHPGNLNVSFGYVDGAALLLAVCEAASVSSGSACSSVEEGPSYVLEALGVPKDWAAASIRFGLGRRTTEAEVAQVGDAVIASVNELRTRSPLWEAHQKGTTIDW